MKNKGITLLSVVICVIVILIVIGITAGIGIELLQKAKMADYAGYMKMVKVRAELVFEEMIFENSADNFENKINNNIGNIVKEEINYSDTNTFQDLFMIDDQDDTMDNYIETLKNKGYYFITWNEEDIKEQGIDGSILSKHLGNNQYDFGYGSYFVIIYDMDNMEVVDVIYTYGCALGKERYFTLNQMEEVLSN